MANAQISGIDGAGYHYYEEASVDTDPGVNGYGCVPVSLRKTIGGKIEQMYFYIKSIAAGATITLQWKRDGDANWVDHGNHTVVGRHVITDRSHMLFYRAIVKDNVQGTGTSVFGIDW